MARIAFDKPAVFLDRDGVLNRSEVRNGKPYAPLKIEDFRLLPGVIGAVRAIKQAGFLVIVVTNQPDIGNGSVDPGVVDAMHEKLRRKVAVDDIRVCPHSQNAGCECRKPKPGMLLQAARDWGIDLRRSVMIGDRWSDIVAGQAAGCYTIFLDRAYPETPEISPDTTTYSLPLAVQHVLARSDSFVQGAPRK